MTTQELGFCDSPKTRAIYINRQYTDCLWYFWEKGATTHEPITRAGLLGYLAKIEIEEKEYEGNLTQKLNIHMRCDRTYILQVAMGTVAAYSLLSNLMLVQDFKEAITVVPEAGEKKSVLFVRVAVNGSFLYSEKGERTDEMTMVNTLVERLTGRKTVAASSAAKTAALPVVKAGAISEAQRQIFAGLVKASGWNIEAVRSYLQTCGYSNSRFILAKDFDTICEGLQDTGDSSSETSFDYEAA